MQSALHTQRRTSQKPAAGGPAFVEADADGGCDGKGERISEEKGYSYVECSRVRTRRRFRDMVPKTTWRQDRESCHIFSWTVI